MAEGALAGIRVLDLATVIAGPGAARYLADFGADVLKIERPGAGDSIRTMGLPDPRDGTSLYWKVVGRNKRCATLDLQSPDGRDALLRLADEAHVLIENFRPGVLERLGLAPDVLLERNPRLVVCRVTAFGQGSGRDTATIARELDAFNAINREESQRLHVAWADVAAISRRAGSRAEQLTEDGLHPSGAQYAAWLTNILPLARQTLSSP